jgi:hypothetical protein
MNKSVLFRRMALCVATAAAAARLTAASTDTQQLNFTLHEVIDFDAIENAVNFTIASFDAGGNGSNSRQGHYKLLCNANAAQKITVALDAPMPANTALDVSMVPPVGATHIGPINNLGTTATDIITGINKVHVLANDINYTFRATVAAATGSFARVITFSVVP